MEQQQGQMDMMGKVADLKLKAQSGMMDLQKKAMELKFKGAEAQLDHATKIEGAQIDHEVSVKKMEGEIQRDALKTATAQTGSKD